MKKGVDFTLPLGQTNEEEADLGVEDADRDEEEADLRHGVRAAAGAGTPPRTSGPERKKPLGRHSRHAPALTAGFSQARWKRKQEEEEEQQWGVATLIKGGGSHGERRRFHPPARAPSRVKELSPSRQSPHEPPRRHPKSLARAATSSAAKKRGFLAFPHSQAERPVLALESLAS
jgi:hypothetical protein